jgi:DNA-directed RNA polymerase subunit RPC12/RpoP
MNEYRCRRCAGRKFFVNDIYGKVLVECKGCHLRARAKSQTAAFAAISAPVEKKEEGKT